ncbi:sigma-70 family RNA polymerase sigma factor [Kaistella sp.]
MIFYWIKSARKLTICPPKCREVFILSKVDGLKYKEIAEQLNISTKTIENHMTKALRIIREAMLKK